MLQTITPAEMKRIEQRAIEEKLVDSLTLMERAAEGVAAAALELCAHRSGTVLCLCGPGNNGGDGLAAMRLMAVQRPSMQGECWLLPGKRSAELEQQLARLVREQPGLRVIELDENSALPALGSIACIIDGLFGTGLSRLLTGLAQELCRLCNRLHGQQVPVVAVDIPSGLDGCTGVVLGEAVTATETVTFHRPKPGLYLGQGIAHAGKITIRDIGLPDSRDDAAGYRLLEPSDLPAFLPPRPAISHKGTYGRVLLWVGHRGMAGAAALCATAALRTGAGLVTVACWDELVDVVQTLCPCATCLPLPRQEPNAAFELLQTACLTADSLGIGCGLGQEPITDGLLKRLLAFLARRAEIKRLPLVLDADGLNLLSAFTPREKEAARPALYHAILTPHPAEAARLLGCATAEITADPVRAAVSLSREYGAAVLVKGAVDVLAADEGIALNVLGTPALAKGGSGDVLTGVMTALRAGLQTTVYPLSTLECMQAAAGLHGLAGLHAQRRFGERGVLATDLCEYLGLTPLPTGVFPTDESDWDALPGHSQPLLRAAELRERATKAAPSLEAAAPTAPSPSQGSGSAPSDGSSPVGRRVTVTIDHKLGSKVSPESDRLYPLNCGYVQEELADRNRWQDACIYGILQPLEFFEGNVAAVMPGGEGREPLWIVVPDGLSPTREQLTQAAAFWGADKPLLL